VCFSRMTLLHIVSKYCFFIQFYMVLNKFYDDFVNGMTSLSHLNISITVRFFW